MKKLNNKKLLSLLMTMSLHESQAMELTQNGPENCDFLTSFNLVTTAVNNRTKVCNNNAPLVGESDDLPNLREILFSQTPAFSSSCPAYQVIRTFCASKKPPLSYSTYLSSPSQTMPPELAYINYLIINNYGSNNLDFPVISNQ